MRTLLFALVVAITCAGPELALAEAPRFELEEGDRVTLLGAGLVERQQQHGYLETALTTRQPGLDVSYRNLGWSGDTVWGEARGVFGGQPQGFERLMNDLRLSAPTVILIAYGNNEAHAGRAGLPRFEQGLEHLLDKLAASGARLVLLSPLEREQLGEPLPNTAEYNRNVKLYGEAIQKIAAARELPYIELNPLAHRTEEDRPLTPSEQLTTDTFTLTPYGSWLAADRIATALGLPPRGVAIELDAKQPTASASGGEVTELAAAGDRYQFKFAAQQLPQPALPPHAPEGAEEYLRKARMVAAGLPQGSAYRLTIDGQEVARGTAEQWARGIAFVRLPEQQQAEQLRALIVAKNELFFHRHRPQNETYLFLFRKREQGNNAVEIPQFDPLIESKEHAIADTRQPLPRRYVLEAVPAR